MAHLSRAQARVEAELGREGRVLVRWSGTEPKLRIMVEGPDEPGIRALAQEMAAAARRDLSA
jgi:phosphoglucosamine mutase